MSFGKRRMVPAAALAAEAAPPSGIERRSATRHRTSVPGLVFPGGMAASVPCVVVDQSVTGARIEMAEGWTNPFHGHSSVGQVMRLVMRVDRVEVDCQIVHVDETAIGVRFVSVIRPMSGRL